MRVTDKLKKALAVLSDETLLDCSEKDLLKWYVRVEPFSQFKLYGDMQRLGYRWTGHEWKRYKPRWFWGLIDRI